jgi:ubiquinone/menaquinone biosynthesis C-methylase UbiE
MILEAKNSCKGKATFNVADAEMLPFEDNTFDIVVCNASFHHYIHPDAVLGEIRRVLKNGGRLLIGDPYIPTGLRSVMNVMLRFSDSGDYHIYGLKEMENLLEENGLNPLSSQKTSERTAFYVASK